MLRPRPQALKLSVPGQRRPLWLRRGTSDVETFEEIFITRQYELPFADFAPATILDLGANVGYASIYFAARWPRANILALEPVAENFRWLERNAAAWPQITCLRAAVWAHAARLQVVNPHEAANAFRLDATAAERSDAGMADEIPAVSIDELTPAHGHGSWDLVKMDVEGAEAEIFRAGGEWLEHAGVLVVELHDRVVPHCTSALCDALAGRKFRMEILGSNLAFDFR